MSHKRFGVNMKDRPLATGAYPPTTAVIPRNPCLTRTMTVLMLVSGLIVAGCSVQKEWTETNASRADGTVTLAYQVGGLEKPVIDPEQGPKLATLSCSDWGYTGAKPLGVMNQCTQMGEYGCLSYLVSQHYQCLGAPTTSKVQ